MELLKRKRGQGGKFEQCHNWGETQQRGFRISLEAWDLLGELAGDSRSRADVIELLVRGFVVPSGGDPISGDQLQAERDELAVKVAELSLLVEDISAKDSQLRANWEEIDQYKLALADCQRNSDRLQAERDEALAENERLKAEVASIRARPGVTTQEPIKELPTVQKAIAILDQALLLKANSGGAIKQEIRKAIAVLY